MNFPGWSIVIDTSASTGAVLLLNGEELISGVLLEPRRQEEMLAETVNNFLSSIKDRQGALSRIILGEGPGSFTGLRIAYAFAKGLTALSKVEIILVSSLIALGIAATPQSQLPVTYAREARRGEYFIQTHSHEGISPCVIIEKTQLSHDQAFVVVSDVAMESLPLEIVAKGFLAATKHGRIVGWQEFAALEPQYGRAAAAKTSAERKGEV